MRRRAAVLLLTGVLSVAACGGGAPDVTDAATADLAPRVAEIRARAGGGDAPGAAAELAELRTAVDALVARGDLSEAGARRVLEAAQVVEVQLASITTTTTTTTTTVPPAPAGGGGGAGGGDDDDEDADKGGDKGGGKRDGKGRDD